MADQPGGKAIRETADSPTGRRGGREVSEAETAALLGRISRLRTQCVRALAALPVGGPEYRVAATAMTAMDDLAERLTGHSPVQAPVIAS